MYGTRLISTNIPIPRGGLVNDKTASGERGATQRIDSIADLLLLSLWDETASGT